MMPLAVSWQRPDLKVFGNYALVMDEKMAVFPL